MTCNTCCIDNVDNFSESNHDVNFHHSQVLNKVLSGTVILVLLFLGLSGSISIC